MKLIAIFLLLAALVLIFLTGRLAWRARQIDRWPTAPGKFIKKEIASPLEEWYGLKGAIAFVSSRFLKVEYAFTVNGAEFTSQNLYPVGLIVTWETPGGAEKTLRALPDNPVVHYNPRNPADSYIINIKWFPYLSFVASLIFGAYCFYRFL